MPGFHHPDDQPDSIIISVQSPGRAPGGPTVPVAGWPGAWTVFPKFLTLFRGGLPQSTFEVTGYSAPNLAVSGPSAGYSDVAMLAGDILADRDSAEYLREVQRAACNLGLDVKTFGGAKGDGTTDDAAALRAAVAVTPGGQVTLPPGTFVVGSTVANPSGSTIRGWGRSLTTVKAAPGFAGPLFTLSSFGSRLENLTVDSAHVVNSVGASSNNINEQSGCRDVCFVNFQRAGLVVDGTGSPLFPQGWSLESCEFFLDAGTTYSSPSCVELTLTFPGKFDTCTFNSTLAGTVPPNSAGTRLGTNAGAMTHDNIHVENLATGIAGLSYGCVVDHFTVGPNVTTGIAVATGANNFAIIGATPSGSVANTVVDPDRGWSSGDVAVTDYVISAGGTLPQQTWINATANGTSQFPFLNVTQGGTINGPFCFTNDTTSPNILAINSVSFGGDNQGGFLSSNSKFGVFPNWFKTSSAASNNAQFLRIAPTVFEVRFGNAANAQGSNPGASAFLVTAAGVTVPTRLITAASATTAAGLSVPPGAAPTSPVDGDVWTTTAGIFARINGSTVGPFGVAGSGGMVMGGAIGGSPTVGDILVVGASGVLGQVATIPVASVTGAAPLASPALTGTPTAPTATVGTNTTQIATTAFVLANAGGGGGSGTVTSVAMTVPGVIFTTPVSGSPVTTSGTLALALKVQSANIVLAGPSSGASATPTFRALVAADVPDLSGVYLTTNEAITLSGNVTGTGTTAIATTIANGAVTLARMANMATASLLGRAAAGTGSPEVLSAATASALLGLGALATLGTVDLSTLATGTLQAAQFPALTGNVTTTAGSLATTIAAGAVTNAMLAGSIAAAKLVGSDIVVTESQVTSLTTDLAAKAPIASPTFTGVPAAPTATSGTSTTQLATTAFATTADNLKAPLASPTFTGTATIPVAAIASHYGAWTTATDASTVTLDLSITDKYVLTSTSGIGSGRTLAFSNFTVGQVLLIEFIQAASGGPYTVTWPTIRWASGTTPTPATVASKADLFTIVKRSDGTYAGALSIPNY